jgi:hypothetical protein
MASVALSTNQQGATPIPGVSMVAVMTLTPGTTATAGEDLDFTAYFSTVDAVVPCGGSNANIVKYVPAFSFTPGATATSSSVKFYCLVQDGAAGVLEPDDSTDLSSTGTFQVIVYGKAA